MTRLFLNVGSSSKKLPGFINVDIDPVADLCADLTHTLPFAGNSVDGIFSEHFIEHISQAEGASFLRECRRILAPGGLLRIATPDLDYIAERYTDGWREQSWLTEFGYDWIVNRCEMFNTSMREWGHKWVYNEEELARLAGYAGLDFKARCVMGESDEPAFRGLEYRQDSKLILEFTKPRRDDSSDALVSILIPAYNAKYFHACLDSALSQTYRNLEIIIGDDCPTEAIGKIAAEYADNRIKYHRNSPPLGAYQNYLYCFRLASGGYIKFLNDDDTLHPNCVERMAACLQQNPEVTLVTSHRQRINAAGNFLPDIPATHRPVKQDSWIDGVSLASALIGTFVNFVGEPTTAMFRRRDIADNQPHLLSFADRAVAWNVDVAMWLTLLGKGDAIYLIDTLSCFRSHAEQEQVKPGAEQKGTLAWHQVRFDGQRLGFLGPHEPRLLLARPLVSQPAFAWPKEVVSLLQEADAHLAGGDLQAARDSLSEALDFVPDDAQLILALGNIQLKLGDAEAAFREFIKAATLHPEHAPAYANLAVALLQLGRADDAEKSLRRSLALNPADTAARKLLGTLCLNSERYAEGVQAYAEVLRQTPEDVEALLVLGNCYFEAGNTDSARAMYEQVLKIDPDTATAAENLAIVAGETATQKESAPTGDTGDVSIIIPVFNKVELTRQCLAGIAQHTSGVHYEIIVIDNASSDDTAEFLHRQSVRVISNKANLGFARACNQGGLAACGNYLLFLNNDTVPTPGWLEALLTAAHKPEVGVVGAKLLYPDGRIQHAGIGFINGIPDHPNRFAPADAPEVNQYRELDMVTGACLMIPKELFAKLGGFDESYRNGVEDIDLCLRARTAGFKVVYEPKAVLYHHEGQSAGRFDHVQQNLQLFFARWRLQFDAHGQFLPPGSPAIITAERSMLLEPSAELGEVKPDEAQSPAAPTNDDRPVAVRWEGSQFVHHSLALINREICIQLAQTKDVALSIIPYEPHQFGVESDPRFKLIADHLAKPLPGAADVLVRHQWPPNFNPPAEGRWVMIQPWEFGSIPKDWIETMRDQVDEVWAYTNFVRECYIRSGLPAERVHVVPPGVDTSIFKPDAKPLKLKTKKRYKFLFVGGTIWRKGPDVLLDAYLKAFTADDDVCLVIKDMGGSSFYKGMTFADQICKIQADPLAPEILYLTDDMPPRNLPRLYAACDCLVHPYRGEGFGLPIAEAMACGLPVIATGAGACLDFCDESVAYLIPARKQYLPEKRIGERETVDMPFMYEPDREATMRLMRQVFEKPHLARAVGAQASKRIRQKFSWEHSVERVLERLRALRGQPVLRHSRGQVSDEIETAFIKGNIAVAAGRWEEAGTVFEALARKHPQLASAQAAFASTLLVQGEFGRAIPLFKRAVDLSPDDSAFRNQLGVALFQSGDSNSAEATFQNLLTRDPDNVDALLNMVEVYRAQKRYGEAAQHVKRAVQTAPKDPNVLAAFGTLGLELGDPEAAQIALDNLREVAPEHPAAKVLQEALA